MVRSWSAYDSNHGSARLVKRNIAVSADGLFSKGMRISQCTTAQNSNVFHRQAGARLQLRVIEVEKTADALLARIVPGPNESADEA